MRYELAGIKVQYDYADIKVKPEHVGIKVKSEHAVLMCIIKVFYECLL
jgi:hypothetical protein